MTAADDREVTTAPEPPDGTRIEFQEYGSPGGDLIGIHRDDASSAEAGYPIGDGGKVWCEYGRSVPITWAEVLDDPRLAAAVEGLRLEPAGAGYRRAVDRLRDGEAWARWARANDDALYDHDTEMAAAYLEAVDQDADSARQETPQTAQPRVWVLPTIPEDVKHLSAVGGDLIARRDAEDGRYWEIYSALTGRCLVPYMSTRQLVAEYSPLTEVVS